MANEDLIIKVGYDNTSVNSVTGETVRKFQISGERAGAFFSKSFQSAIVGLGAKIATVFAFKEAISEALSFEKALVEVSTITNITESGLEVLSSRLTDVALQFGTNAQDQAKSYYQIISAGVTDAVAANELLIASNKLAIGGLADQAESIDILTTAVNSYGVENLKASRAADILFGTVKLGKTTVSELASSLGQILPSANAIGVSFEETSAALAKLTTKGVSTSEAVTQLNAVFTAVLRKQDTAQKMGKDVAEAFTLQALRTKGLTQFLSDLNKALGGSEEKLVKLLGRAEGAKAILSLASDGFKGLASNVDALTNSSGNANEAFQKISKTMSFKLNKAWSNFILLLQQSIELARPFITGLLDAINVALENSIMFIKNFGTNFDIFILNIKKNFALFTIELLQMMEKVPGLSNVFGVVISTNMSIAARSFAKTSSELEKLEKSLTGIESLASSSSSSVSSSISKMASSTSDSISNMDKTIQSLNNTFKSSLVNGITNSIGSIVSALVKGEDAFSAFGNSVLQLIGDLAIMMGKFMVSAGIAKMALISFDPTGTIAAGLGLIALGSLLKSISGSSFVGGGAENAGVTQGGFTPIPQGQVLDQPSPEQAKSSVVVNVEGTVLDPVGVGKQIAEVLDEAFNAGASTIAVNTA